MMADVDKGDGDRAAGNLRFTASEMLIYILLIQLKVDTVSLSIDIYEAYVNYQMCFHTIALSLTYTGSH